jgi:hypothetical protein
MVLLNSPPFLLKSLQQFLQSLRRWLTTAHVAIQVIHKCSIGFKSSDLNGYGATVTLWLARKSTVARAVCDRALSCWKTSLRRFTAGNMCGVKTSSLYRAALRLSWMCTSWVFRRRIRHLTSSLFLRRNCRPQGRGSLRTSHSGVCRHVYGHFFSAAWILIHRWTKLASSFASPSPLLCCTIGPLKVDASDVSILRQSKDVWRVSRFHRDSFWQSVPIFVGDLGYLMLFLLLSRSGFSCEVPGCSDLGLLMCPCCATGQWWAQQILTLKWRPLNAMDYNVINVDILMNLKV